MFDAERYICEYQELEHGTARLRAIKKAIAAADEAQDAHWRFTFRHRYVHESIFESDALDALVVFPEMVAIFDENPDTQEEYLHDLMWDFKNVLCNLPNFPQVSLEEMDRLMNDYEERCKKYGFTQRSAKYLREKHSCDTGRFLPLAEYGNYAQEEPDELKDCSACEANWNVQCELLRGNREKAEKLSKPLFNRELSCAEVPEETYSEWIAYLQKQGDYLTAKLYAKRLYPMVRGRIELLNCSANLLRFYAKFDRHTGSNILRREMSNFLSCRDLMMKMEFAAGAYHLFANMIAEDITLIFPREFPLFNEDHHYSAKALADYFYNEAKQLAERFDARNGNRYYTDKLNEKLPDFDEDAVDFVHGDAEQEVSVLGAICKTLPDALSLESVSKLLKADGRFHAELMRADQEHNVLQFQIMDEDLVYQVVLTVQNVPPLGEFRPGFPVPNTLPEQIQKAEGVISCIMPFEEHQPDIALHFQMQFLNLICPDALAIIDYTRFKLLPNRWVAMEAESSVPPVVDLLYNIRLFSEQDDNAVWIATNGMGCCSMRELEFWDADKQNYARFCDLLCFVAEKFLLRGEMPDAATPFEALRMADGSPLLLAWLPAEQALAYYGDDSGAAKLRTQLIGEDADEFKGRAVLFIYDGENADGSAKLKRMNTLTEEDFENFRYGQYIVTGKKIAALAKERFGIFCNCFAQEPEEAYVCVNVELEDDEDDIWMNVTAINGSTILGKLCDDCLVGSAGTEYSAEVSQLLDFSVHHHDLIVQPNSAYLGE